MVPPITRLSEGKFWNVSANEMKNENYNVIINTLDDRSMYKEISRRLSEIDRSRYRSMWLVPLASGLIILLLWLGILHIPTVISVLVSMFGAVITYFIFRWSKQNNELAQVFRKHAALLESRKNEQENLKAEKSNEGPYSLIHHMAELSFPGTITTGNSRINGPSSLNNSGQPGLIWSKEKVESAVYQATILLWLLTFILGLVKIYLPSFYMIILTT